MKRRYTVTVALGEGEQIGEQEFPVIEGRIIGYSSHTVGTKPGITNLAILDGGNEVERPIDVAFSETAGRSSFPDGQLELNIQNPGRMTARVQTDAPVANGQILKVQVVITSTKEVQSDFNCQ